MSMFLRRVTPFKVRLSQINPGEIIKLNESSSPVEFYIAKHNYEAGLNGDGRTLMVRRDCYGKGTFSEANTTLNNAYLQLLDPKIQTAVGTTKFYYVATGSTSNEPTIRQRAVFMLSLKEFSAKRSDASTEGEEVPIGEILRIAYFNGKAVDQWTRTPVIDGGYMICTMKSDGSTSYTANGRTACYRPVFTLPGDMILTEDMLA